MILAVMAINPGGPGAATSQDLRVHKDQQYSSFTNPSASTATNTQNPERRLEFAHPSTIFNKPSMYSGLNATKIRKPGEELGATSSSSGYPPQPPPQGQSQMKEGSTREPEKHKALPKAAAEPTPVHSHNQGPPPGPPGQPGSSGQSSSSRVLVKHLSDDQEHELDKAIDRFNPAKKSVPADAPVQPKSSMKRDDDKDPDPEEILRNAMGDDKYQEMLKLQEEIEREQIRIQEERKQEIEKKAAKLRKQLNELVTQRSNANKDRRTTNTRSNKSTRGRTKKTGAAIRTNH
jgi:hypothetical protein